MPFSILQLYTGYLLNLGLNVSRLFTTRSTQPFLLNPDFLNLSLSYSLRTALLPYHRCFLAFVFLNACSYAFLHLLIHLLAKLSAEAFQKKLHSLFPALPPSLSLSRSWQPSRILFPPAAVSFPLYTPWRRKLFDSITCDTSDSRSNLCALIRNRLAKKK